MSNARDLSNRLAELLRRERHAMADFLLALADFDRRALWRELGHASLFAFLRRELGRSAGAAQYRKTAAELLQRFPEVGDALRSGHLCLSSVVELAKVITPENSAAVLPRFFGLSSREAALVAVSIRPVDNPPLREVVTPLRATAPLATRPLVPCQAPAPAGTEASLELRAHELAPDTNLPTLPGAGSAPVATPRTTVEPLDAQRVRLHLTVSRRLLAKIEAAKDALSHARPGASSEDVLEASLDLLLSRHARRKGLVEKPRTTSVPGSSTSATAGAASCAVPAAVKREVWKRAGGRCEWKLDSGGVCGSTVRLEYDHIVPRAHGGPSTVDNGRILCRAHSQLAARQAFGDAWMAKYARRRSGGTGPSAGVTTAQPVLQLTL